MVPTRRARRPRSSPGERFTYEVDLHLGGQRHVATATWPDDVIPGNEPSVALHVEPELPALE